MPFDPKSFTGLAQAEADLFATILAGVSGLGVEIGCLEGFSSNVILANSQLRLTSIDPLVPDSMEPSLKGNEERLRSNMADFGDRWLLLKDFSQNVSKIWLEKLDFLFIDGDHTYEAVCRDYDEWVPFLKPGGILAIHDSRMGRPGSPKFHEGPSRLARERVYGQPQWKILGEAFTLTVAAKL